LYLRPPATSFTRVPREMLGYFTERQWQQLSDEVAANRPEVVLPYGRQWEEIVKRHPELGGEYRERNDLLYRISR
jgi:hypothetical protein